MGIDATSSAVSSSSSSAQVSSASNSDNAKKTSSDSSFKDELDKVSSTETKDDKKTDKTDAKTDAKTSEKSDAKTDKVESKDTNDTSKTKKVASDKDNTDAVKLAGNVDFSQYGTLSVKDPNAMLADSNDIRQMINNTSQISALSDLNKAGSIFGYDGMNSNSISMNESDAQFFINLTHEDGSVSAQNVMTQAQNMLNNGADVSEVSQNTKVSEALLNAINTAKENNQPLRIDFDQNVSVILRIGKDGTLAANFIPGDKAVEQYLKDNINSLKATFNENDLPYTDLSYSNSSKQQNQQRRNKQQQGE